MSGARRAQGGFSLLEVMVAAGIVTIITVLVWGSLHQTLTAKRELEGIQDRYRAVRLTLGRLTRELQVAYLSTNEDLTAADRRTLFVGEDRSDLDRVRFSSLAHLRLREDAHESDQSVIEYYGDRDPEDRGRMDLWRRETRRTGNEPLDKLPGEAYVLCRDVVAFQLEYLDARSKEWRADWSTISADGQPNRLPARIRLTLTVRDERGEPIPYVTEVAPVLQEPFGT